MSRLLRIKPMSMLSQEAGEEGEHTLKRTLSALNLITLGIGAVIGAGIFTLTGQAAALHAGPAVSLSFVLAGLTCAFAGLCYAEFASIIPIAGSAYTYGYATLGELVAWIIGWDLTLEYAFGASTVASGWAGYFNSLLQQLGIVFPQALTTTTGNVLVKYQGVWIDRSSLPPGITDAGLPQVTGIFNLIAVLIVLVITTILVIGIKESANFNSAIVIIKLGIVGIFLAIGGYFLFHHPAVASANWHPFIPPVGRSWQLRLWWAFPSPRRRSFLPISASTPFQPPRRRPRIRSATCPSAFLVRWWSAPSSTSWFRWCSPAWSTTRR